MSRFRLTLKVKFARNDWHHASKMLGADALGDLPLPSVPPGRAGPISLFRCVHSEAERPPQARGELGRAGGECWLGASRGSDSGRDGDETVGLVTCGLTRTQRACRGGSEQMERRCLAEQPAKRVDDGEGRVCSHEGDVGGRSEGRAGGQST